MFKRLILVVLVTISCIISPLEAAATGTNTIDYTALFDKEATVDGYLAEGYYFEINQIFQNAPEKFVTELAKRPFEQINSIAFAIATQQTPSEDTNLNAYKEFLLSLDSSFGTGTPEYETIYVMKLCISRMDVGSTRLDPLYFEKTRHAEIKSYYNENNRLFLFSMGELGDTIQLKYADALIYELSESELKALDDTLASNSNEDWATEDIKVIIDTFRNRIDEALNPVPPDLDPDPTEPDPTEPDPTEHTPTENTTPTVPEEQPKDTSANNNWLIPTLCIGAVLIAAISLVLTRKKK